MYNSNYDDDDDDDDDDDRDVKAGIWQISLKG